VLTLVVSGPTADGGERLRLEQRGRVKTVEWPHLKSAGSYEKCKSPTAT
jgi:hypothetical protein